jgi:hypothetical protein
MAKHKYEGYVLLLTLVGSLSVVAAGVIAYGLVPPTDLVLTQSEWEALAIVLYVFAVIIYVAGGEKTGSQRACQSLVPRFTLRNFGRRFRPRHLIGESPRAEIERTTVGK